MNEQAPPSIDPHELDDLRSRIRSTRRSRSIGRDGSRGTGADFMTELLGYWADEYNWVEHETRIRSWPWQLVQAGNVPLRVIHQRSAADNAPVVLLLHGWPDSVLRFERLMPRLTDFHLVIPALPGFPFAATTDEPAMSAGRMAEVIAAGMAQLGYDRYTISAGDVGGDVAELLAVAHPETVQSLQLMSVSPKHAVFADATSLPSDAREYIDGTQNWFRQHGGYIAIQSTRPDTLGVGLSDSPAGLAAWIAEKLLTWSDPGRAAFTHDELLTWITAYWLTNTIGTSFSSYAELTRPVDRVEAPTLISAFAHDIKPAPRSFAESFVNVREFVEHAAGGHFGAWEQPDVYSADLRRAVELGSA